MKRDRSGNRIPDEMLIMWWLATEWTWPGRSTLCLLPCCRVPVASLLCATVNASCNKVWVNLSKPWSQAEGSIVWQFFDCQTTSTTIIWLQEIPTIICGYLNFEISIFNIWLLLGIISIIWNSMIWYLLFDQIIRINVWYIVHGFHSTCDIIIYDIKCLLAEQYQNLWYHKLMM